MILGSVKSVDGVKIRLTQERWNHITTSHLEFDPDDYKIILHVIRKPNFILKGDFGELLAVKKQARKNSWIVVPYKELSQTDGFILTAYLTTDSSWLFQKEIIWNKQ